MSRLVRPSAASPTRAESDSGPSGDTPARDARDRPFKANTAPDLLWVGPRQQQIVDDLRSGVLAREGVLLLTGDIGTGKTILARAVLHQLRASTIVASLMYTRDNAFDFWKEIADGWGDAAGIPPATDAYEGYVRMLLENAAARDKQLLLFVDEGQALSQSVLTEIGRLAEIAGAPRSRPRLSILLVGQDELEAVLTRPENSALADRAGVRCLGTPLTDAEVRQYVAHQLRGEERTGPFFTEGGLRELTVASQGIPRVINTIADLAMLTSTQEGALAIGAATIRRCARGFVPSDARTPLTIAPPVEEARTLRTRRPMRGAALGIPLLVLLLTFSASLYYGATWHRHASREGDTAVVTPSTISPQVPSSGGGIPPSSPPREACNSETSAPPTPRQPDALSKHAAPSARSQPDAPSKHAAPSARSQSDVSAQQAGPRLPEQPRPAPPVPPVAPPLPPVRQPDPGVAEGGKKQPEGSVAGAPGAALNETTSVSPAANARRPSAVQAGEESGPVHPTAIIDWVLSDYPARRP